MDDALRKNAISGMLVEETIDQHEKHRRYAHRHKKIASGQENHAEHSNAFEHGMCEDPMLGWGDVGYDEPRAHACDHRCESP